MITLGLDATPLLGQLSGVGFYTMRLMEALIEHNPGWRFRLFTNRPLPDLELGTSAQRIEQVRGGPARSRWLWMQTGLARAITRESPDLMHFTNGIAPASAARPYVLTLHDASLFLYSQYHPRKRLLAMRFLQPVAARRAAAVIVPTNTARRDVLRALQLDPAKVHVVNEAAPATFRPVRDGAELARLRRIYDLPPAFVLCVGTIEPRKNLRRLLEAMKLVNAGGRHVPLVLAGPLGWRANGSQRSKGLDALVAEVGLGDSVRYLGYVPTADLPGLYSLATVFAFPSLYEGFGLPVTEAMACGAPIVTSTATAMAEVCDEAAVTVDPYDVAELGAAISGLLADGARRAELGEAGLARAAAFSWSRAAAETTAIYRDVLESSA